MGLCLLSLRFYGQYWQDTFSHIQGRFRASSLSVSPRLELGPFLPAWISILLSLPISCTQCWRMGWGQERWRGNLLSTPCFPTINNHSSASTVALFDLFTPVKNAYGLHITGMLKQVCCCVCLCLHMHSKSPLSSDLQFGFNCCVNLSSTLIGCSLLMLLRRITLGLCDAFTLRHPTNLHSNHILITQLHQACVMAAHSNSSQSIVLCITFAREWIQCLKQNQENDGVYTRTG